MAEAKKSMLLKIKTIENKNAFRKKHSTYQLSSTKMKQTFVINVTKKQVDKNKDLANSKF